MAMLNILYILFEIILFEMQILAILVAYLKPAPVGDMCILYQNQNIIQIWSGPWSHFIIINKFTIKFWIFI